MVILFEAKPRDNITTQRDLDMRSKWVLFSRGKAQRKYDEAKHNITQGLGSHIFPRRSRGKLCDELRSCFLCSGPQRRTEALVYSTDVRLCLFARLSSWSWGVSFRTCPVHLYFSIRYTWPQLHSSLVRCPTADRKWEAVCLRWARIHRSRASVSVWSL